MIRRTELRFDLGAIRKVVDGVHPLFRGGNQLSVTCRPNAEQPLYDTGWLPEGATEADYSVVNPEFRDSAIEELLNGLPFRFGRTRLMKMPPKSCLSIHEDSSLRYHYAIITNPDCYLVHKDNGTGTFYHIPADGHLYEMDARKTHTAINASRKERIHLVICPVN